MKVQRPQLTLEAVCTAALQIVDEQGLEALSMRTLASALGVTAMALYRYVPNKEALLAEVLDAVLRGMTLPRADSAAWEEQVLALAGAFRHTLLAHPNVLPLFSARPAASPESLQLFEHGLSLFWAAGFDEATTVRAYYAVFNYTLGFVTTEITRIKAAGLADAEAHDQYLAVPADRFPLIRALTPYINMLDDQQFRYGLQLVLGGLRSLKGERQ